MKKIPFLFIITFLLTACNKSNPQEEQLLGLWKVDSLYNSYANRDTLVKPGNNDQGIIGSVNNPKYIEFKKRHIALGYNKNSKEKPERLSYSVKKDTVIFDAQQQPSYLKIDLLNDSSLVLSSSSPTKKGVYRNTFYYSKEKE